MVRARRYHQEARDHRDVLFVHAEAVVEEVQAPGFLKAQRKTTSGYVLQFDS